ncbi:hypothetical protein P389DRAFT_169375 [Cystobasidium minutum MCA 4210]|uniref:uncharacterized protein n=1 Tax=Cystobasidium minutum MCA 4210 TaxID=1397322 RepID=UPI0034CDEA95|eukprot:jgi/Rhomi1/169375/fgenesh1_kg.3_\
MPGVPEQPKQENKREDKEVDSTTQTDGDSKSSSNGSNSAKGKSDDATLSPERVEELKKDPKVVVHCELQEELDKEFEQRGLHFDKPGKAEGGDDSSKKEDTKQKAGDDKA